MIPVAKVRKPRGFDAKVKTPGDAWLAANPQAKRPKALWAPYTAELSDGFGGLCGYAAMLDPYQVGEGWFEIVLPSLQMRVSDAVPAAMKAKAEHTLQRLKLRDGERVIRWRQSWYILYCSGGLTLDGLRQVAPLLASAVAAAALSSRSPPPPPPAA